MKKKTLAKMLSLTMAVVLTAGAVTGANPQTTYAASNSPPKVVLARPNVKVTGKTQTTVSLDWKNVKGAKGYVVYRSTSKTGTYKKVATVTKSFYKNKKLKAGKSYYYKVRAYKKVNGKTKYSKYSYVDKATTKAKKSTSYRPNIKFSTFANAGETSKLGKASVSSSITSKHYPKLKWDSVKKAQGYVIYRSIHSDHGYEVYDATKYTNYTDKSAKAGKTYYYRVFAYAKFDGKIKTGKTSNVVKVSNNHNWKEVYGEVDNGYYKPTYTCNLCNGLDVTGNQDAHADTHRSYTITEGQKPQKGYHERQQVMIWFARCNQCDAIIADDTANMSTEEYNALLDKHFDASLEKYWEFVVSIEGLPIEEYKQLLSEYTSAKLCGGWSSDYRFETRSVWVPDENGSETKMVAYDKYTCNYCGKEITGSHKTHQCFIQERTTDVWIPKLEEVVIGYTCNICNSSK